jgi:hypothetical protein
MERVSQSAKMASIFLTIIAIASCGSDREEDAPTLEGTTEHAVFAQYQRAPRADAVTTRVNNVLKVWVFACDASNNLRRRVKTISSGTWGSWTSPAVGVQCTGAPAVVKWGDSNATTEQVIVYFRSTANKLYELHYSSSGALTLINLSSSTGFGDISTDPVVVNQEQAANKIAVAVSNSAQRLHTLDYYNGAYHVHPVIDTGTTAVLTPNPVVGYFSSGIHAGNKTWIAGHNGVSEGFIARRGAAYNANYVKLQLPYTTHAKPGLAPVDSFGVGLHLFRLLGTGPLEASGKLQAANLAGPPETLTWTDVPNDCGSVSSSPAFMPLDWNGFIRRGTALAYVDTQGWSGCSGVGGSMDSAPRMFWEDGSHGALFENPSGNLVYFSWADFTEPADLGLDVRP